MTQLKVICYLIYPFHNLPVSFNLVPSAIHIHPYLCRLNFELMDKIYESEGWTRANLLCQLAQGFEAGYAGQALPLDPQICPEKRDSNYLYLSTFYYLYLVT